MTDDEYLSEPHSFLAAVRRHAGEDGLRRAVALLGGQQFNVPNKITTRGWFTRLFTVESAAAMLADPDWPGGITIKLPSPAQNSTARARGVMTRLLLEGHSANQVARMAGRSARSVWRLRAQLIAEGWDLGPMPSKEERARQRQEATSDWSALADKLTSELEADDVEIAEEFGLDLLTVLRLRSRFEDRRSLGGPVEPK